MSAGWTDARIATLERMWADGTPAAAIADALGVTRNAVIGKASRLDLDARAPRGNSKLNWRRLNAKMRALWDDGLPTTRIARKLGISECTARRALRALGLPSHGHNSHGLGSSPLSVTEAPGPVARVEAPATHSHGRGAHSPLNTEAPGPVARAMKPRQPSRAAPGHAQLLPDLAPVAHAAGAPFGDAVTLAALTPFTCRWPLGNWREPATHFCGATCPAAVPYCSEHTIMAAGSSERARRTLKQAARFAGHGFGHADRFLGGE